MWERSHYLFNKISLSKEEKHCMLFYMGAYILFLESVTKNEFVITGLWVKTSFNNFLAGEWLYGKIRISLEVCVGILSICLSRFAIYLSHLLFEHPGNCPVWSTSWLPCFLASSRFLYLRPHSWPAAAFLQLPVADISLCPLRLGARNYLRLSHHLLFPLTLTTSQWMVSSLQSLLWPFDYVFYQDPEGYRLPLFFHFT